MARRCVVDHLRDQRVAIEDRGPGIVERLTDRAIAAFGDKLGIEC